MEERKTDDRDGEAKVWGREIGVFATDERILWVG